MSSLKCTCPFIITCSFLPWIRDKWIVHWLKRLLLCYIMGPSIPGRLLGSPENKTLKRELIILLLTSCFPVISFNNRPSLLTSKPTQLISLPFWCSSLLLRFLIGLCTNLLCQQSSICSFPIIILVILILLTFLAYLWHLHLLIISIFLITLAYFNFLSCLSNIVALCNLLTESLESHAIYILFL